MSAPQAPLELQPPIDTHAPESPADQQPVPEAEVSAPIHHAQPLYVSSAPSSGKRTPAGKTGPPVGVVAGVAVAALTLIGAGVGVALSRKKPPPSLKSTASKAAAGTRTSSRTTSSKLAGSRSASAASTAATSSTARPAPARAPTSRPRAAGTVAKPRPAAASAAAGRRSPAAAATATAAQAAAPAAASPAMAATTPAAPAAQVAPAAPAAAERKEPKAAAAAKQDPADAAAALPNGQAPSVAAPPAKTAVAASAVPNGTADASSDGPLTSATLVQPASEKTAEVAAAAPHPPAVKEQPAEAAPAAASSAKEASPEAAAAEPSPAVSAEAADNKAEESVAAVAEQKPAAEPDVAAGAVEADEQTPASAADASAPVNEDGAGDDGDGLIELAEGETLPVVDENGNQLGTLHADGRVLDEAGTEIGALDEEGNVLLYEQQQPEEAVLSPAEEEAEQFMRHAAVAWNMQHNREVAEKFQRKALEAVTASPGAARPEIIAEVASSLADMLYASDKLIDAKEALQTALDAAEQGEQHALYIKLSNNMGAVLRKQELHEEGKQLHEKAMAVALKHFGVAHATTTLARGNLVDALDQLGDRVAARNLLTTCITDISKLAEQKEEQEAAGKGSGDAAAAAAAVDAATAAAAGAKDGEVTPEMAAMLAVDSVKANTACIRAQIELARLEMKDKQFDRAVEVLDGALDMAKQKFGEETAEASSVMAALATCHRQAGDVEKTVALFTQLFDINKRQSGDSAANQSGIMLARTLTDVCQEAGRLEEALGWAEKSLNLMQQLAGVKVHPALEPYFNLVIDLKNKTGDEAGAEELRKLLLKGKLQMAGQAQRGGAAAAAAAARQGAGQGGRPPTGQAKGLGAGRAGGAGKKGGKRK